MGPFFWGMVGGAVMILVNKGFQSGGESQGKTCHGVMGKLRFCASEVVESLRDLAAESKMEWEAEKASLEEVRLHDKAGKLS
ncbi:MAG: hypothetical protein ISS66_17260 [Desulfobacteraceae bacterium]|nr:hypothetical protein [Desulfobacteraceae bacterium]